MNYSTIKGFFIAKKKNYPFRLNDVLEDFFS